MTFDITRQFQSFREVRIGYRLRMGHDHERDSRE